jgi:hypothetical protein
MYVKEIDSEIVDGIHLAGRTVVCLVMSLVIP